MIKPLRLLIVAAAGHDNQPLIGALRDAGYAPVFEKAATPAEVNVLLDQKIWDAALMDYDLLSTGVLDTLRRRSLPAIVFSAHGGEEAAVKSIKAGAGDFIVESDLSRLGLAADELLKAPRAGKYFEADVDRLRRGLEATIQAISSAVEVRDPFTAGHQRRVSHLACAIAREMDLSADRIDGLHLASAIHDIGKLTIAPEILSKPAKLTEAEYNLIKKHPKAGFDMLKDIDFPWPVARMVIEHHERVDGSGYPSGLTEDRLLLESMILAVSDVVEAVASYRSYRPAMAVDVALDEIVSKKGIHYNAQAVDACIRLFGLKGYKIIP